MARHVWITAVLCVVVNLPSCDALEWVSSPGQLRVCQGDTVELTWAIHLTHLDEIINAFSFTYDSSHTNTFILIQPIAKDTLVLPAYKHRADFGGNYSHPTLILGGVGPDDEGSYALSLSGRGLVGPVTNDNTTLTVIPDYHLSALLVVTNTSDIPFEPLDPLTLYDLHVTFSPNDTWSDVVVQVAGGSRRRQTCVSPCVFRRVRLTQPVSLIQVLAKFSNTCSRQVILQLNVTTSGETDVAHGSVCALLCMAVAITVAITITMVTAVVVTVLCSRLRTKKKANNETEGGGQAAYTEVRRSNPDILRHPAS